MSYTIRCTVDKSFDRAVDATIEALEDNGFGILTDIDMGSTLESKLDVEFRNYRVLGACAPPYAYEALNNEIEVGALLPCNVIVYETDSGEVRVAAADPETLLDVTNNDNLESVADTVQEGLESTLEDL